MTTRIFILSILVAIVSTTTLAQVNVSGKIVDTDSNDAIEFANIALLQQDSSFIAGASSDTHGIFAFNNIPNGNYILSATFVGYTKTYIPVSNLDKSTDLGTITLKASDIALKDVTVTANAVIQKADRKIILPSDAQIKASNSGVTLLRNLQLSRIIINPITNAISVPGGDAVQLRINGVEVTIAEIIALQPADILRIEYHDDPGMRYNNAAAVIDYITRQKESGGNVSTNLSNVPFDMDWGENFLSTKVNHKKSEFGFNTYWSRRGIDWTRENKETFVFPGKVLERKEKGEPTRFKDNNLNMALNYSLNETDKYLFNATLRYNYQDTPNQFSDRKSTIHSSDNPLPLLITDHSTWRNNSPSLDLYYQHNLKNDQLIILNAVGTYLDSRSSRLYQEQRGNELSTDILSIVSGDKYSFIAEAIYEKKIGEGKLSGGLKHTQSYTQNTYTGNIGTNVNLNFAETYGYAEYQLRRNKFNYTFGLGVMRSYNSQGDSNNEKYIFRPTLRVIYNINDNTYIRYNGYISGYSPSLSDLNNVEQDIDSLQIRRGNPNLQTVWYYTNTLNAGFKKGIFGVEFFMRYSYDHKPIMEQITLEEGKFVRTNINQKGFHRINLETTFKLKPFGEYLTLSVSPGLNRYISYGNDFTHTYNNWRIRGGLTANYKKWIFSAEAWTRWNDYWGETLNIGERLHTVSIGYNTEKWSLGIGMFNPFTRSYSLSNQNYSRLTPNISDVYTNNLGQIAVINFTLNLNFGRQYKAVNKRLDNNDTDAGIMSGSKK
ncbi:TonB-dependent receptor [Dysgonomonas sp. Marseille-P4677]|uniref:carboxypeptidase-like regulatory domain-containing protein n=1 Tax=Dysgonomonas sp. Marseille-P4677 TaxID=2364790 RepID=UPI001911B6E0|nr:carboxypeptidase-like regulatory domain-containing protein [Dysgonomonas sp. Marseille-P4677]MBK5722720.1 TonB-dependent receptor [Dysgonomonas sp. Marseille-P4677]